MENEPRGYRQILKNLDLLLLLPHLYGGGFVEIFTGQIPSENDYQIQ